MGLAVALATWYNEKECRAGRVRMDNERGVKRGGNAEKEASHRD